MESYIKVAVRIRPLILSEKEEETAVHWKTKASSSIYPVAYPSNVSEFTHVFTEKEDNEAVYSKFCSPIVQSAFKGFNGAIIAYGQISSGKTFTMMGNEDLKIEGIIHFSIYDLFKLIEHDFDRIYFIRIACIEFHSGKTRDLLCDSNEYLPSEEKMGRNKRPLLIRHTVQEPQDIFNYIKEAQSRRKAKCTLKNKNGSGSSMIIDLFIESLGPVGARDLVKISHLFFVDLAGNNEDSLCTETRYIPDTRQKLQMEKKKVIQHLENNKGKSQFILRQGTLRPKIFSRFFAGNFETAVICTVSPTNLHETYAYLEIASLAQRIKNKPRLTIIESNIAHLMRFVNQLKQLIQDIQAAEQQNHNQCKNLEKKLRRLERFWHFHFLCLSQIKYLYCEKISGCSNELRFRKPLPQQPFIYSFCTLKTSEPKKRV